MEDRIMERLGQLGVSRDFLNQGQPGLVAFVKGNQAVMDELVAAIFPNYEDVKPLCLSANFSAFEALEALFRESMTWLQWLLFMGDPETAIGLLSQLNGGQRGVCGATWTIGKKAFRCDTCAEGPGRAICDKCFKAGDHEGHDSHMISVTAGVGCCDCGDAMGWKPSGFCSKHKGTEHIATLPSEFGNSMGPVLDSFFNFWRTMLEHQSPPHVKEAGEKLTYVAADILFKICERSECLVSIISKKFCSVHGLIEIVVRAERWFTFINQTERLHDLLLKLLDEPQFKSEFAKVYLDYYPTVIALVIEERSYGPFHRFPLLKRFSPHIFTMHALTPQLPILLECLEHIIVSCVGRGGRLKLEGLHDVAVQVVECIRFVMCHCHPTATHEWQAITRTYLRILSFLQGIYPEREDSENVKKLFTLGYPLAMVHSYLVHTSDSSEEVENDSGRENLYLPPYVSWLALECLRTLFKPSEVQLTSTGEVLGRQNSITSRHSTGSLNSWQYLGEEAGGSNSDCISTETDCGSHPDSQWPDVVYDVSSHDISIHIPLHRLLSMILHRSLKKCYGESAHSGRLSLTPLEDFFPNICGGCHPYRLPAFLMEHPLRIRVFFAQVQANSRPICRHADTVAREVYRSATWCEKGLELDLFLLQCCAALAPPDLYVKRILERYGLSCYLNLNPERSSEFESTLVLDMLTLIIQIVKERRFVGLTIAECLERELVYKLSIEEATHSELLESVPQDLPKTGVFQQILDSVAVYSDQGKYKLRPGYWKKVDLYHPRYSLKELQKAYENYFKSSKKSAVAAQLPKWTYIYQPLSGIARIATCKTTLQIVRAVLSYAVSTEESMAIRAPEHVVLTALHLLYLALDIRASGQRLHNIGEVIKFATEETLLSLLVSLMRHHKQKTNEISSLCSNVFKKFAELEPKWYIELQKIVPEVFDELSESNSNLDDSMSGRASDSQKDKGKAAQANVAAKFKAKQSEYEERHKSEFEEADVSEGREDLAVCSLCHDTNSKSPMCFLIHLQKSRVFSFLDRGPVSWERSWQSKADHFSPGESAIGTPISDSSHLELADLVRNAVDSFASDSQPHEINAFLRFINLHFPSVRNVDYPLGSKDVLVETSSTENLEDVLVKTCSIENLEEHMYSLVQENLRERNFQKYGDDFSIAGGTQQRSSQCLLLGKYVASISEEIINNPSRSENLHFHHNEAQSSDSIRAQTYDGFGPRSDFDGVHISSCGHPVHQDCLERHLSYLKNMHARRTPFRGSHVVDLEKGEFLCLECSRVANSALPTPLRNSEKVPRFPVSPNPAASDSGASSSREVNSLRIQEAACLMESAAFTAGNKESLKLITLQRFEGQNSNISSLSGALCSIYFPSKCEMLESGRNSISLLLWDVLKYSVASAKIAARSGNLISTPTCGSDFSHTLLLNIVQSSRTKDVPTTLLRYRGIQLLIESLCLGSANVEQNQLEGSLLFLLEISDPESDYLDTQFWKQVSRPVLANDPFSSLMWALFCLPTPFLSCKESFLCLVHIFYLVTITQAIITCCRKQCILTECGPKDSLITDICKVTRNHEILLQCFDSNYIDSCDEYKDAIRTVSCTFLRRCALLWDLISSSASFPFSPGNQVTCGSVDHQHNLAEVERLELMLGIPPMDVVINDGMSRSMATRWLHHFTKEFKLQAQNVLYCTPSVPLSLVVLPDHYEDLILEYESPCCPDCGLPLVVPALCLLCSKLCSAFGSLTCCRASGCHAHAMVCGAGIGAFLVMRSTCVMIQRAGKTATLPSLYLDKFGEEDLYFKRGKPLYLNYKRYLQLTETVASHGLHTQFCMKLL